MRIAVNARLLIKDQLEGIGRFTFETLRRLVLSHPEVEFIFCFDRKFDPEFIFAPNVKGLVIYPQARHPFLYYIWFQLLLPKVLEREKVDLLLSPDGFLPLNTKVKTLAVIHDIAFEHFKNGVDWLHQYYYKYYFPKFAKKATRIIAVSQFTKTDLVKTYQLEPEKIDVIYNGVSSAFKQTDKMLKDKIPYFIYVGAIHPRKNVLNLLKAFDAFKTEHSKFQHQLLLVGRKSWKLSSVVKYLKTMKFKRDVLFNKNVSDNDLNLLLNNATALIYPSFFEGFGLPVVEGFSCGIPVITSKNTAMEEIAKGAAHLFDPNNVTEISKRMYEQASGKAKNQEKINLGLTLAKQYNWDSSAEQIWQSILKTIN
ncbi:MAG TPA: glycosyltransferase family 1 protein [Pelobium sp.]|nr:glycosyltransferase family 1 protein [Pelobium sp.]